ncbi:hypothetical protein [Rahnella sp. ChDrAdgB13]|uniref:hypothetical protein n=1 Tax=Rahnella sp. ChDrAdgB13 TaxID=1850581 RepID=UPI001AD88509|nr:hypothetical protein [Rahnella sp. ChDrAdgB13]
MIYRNVETNYINSKTDSRLIRYDVIKIDNDTYHVKVIDEQQAGIAQPNLLVQVDQFDLTRQQYNEKYDVGNRAIVRTEMLPGFEGTISDYLQDHRNKIS